MNAIPKCAPAGAGEPGGSAATANTVLAAAAFARDLISLTKPRITGLVLLTQAAGMWLAPARAAPRTLLLAFVGTALIVGAANTLNMWWERDVDARMSRTRARPLPAGRMSPEVALAFGVGLALVSVPILFVVSATTGLLGVIALVSYVAVYTPLKRRSYLALVVGAVPGAMPPLLGWSAATGGVGLGGVLLFTVLFFWQVPHFAAISIFRADDYARAGLRVVSVQRGEPAARRMIAAYGGLLVATSLLFEPLGLAGPRYTAFAAVLDAALLAFAIRGLTGGSRFDTQRWAKRVFGFSIVYLAMILGALLSDPLARGGASRASLPWAPRGAPLPVLGHVPAFRLIDQHGAPYDTASMLGHVSVVDFIFTRCPSSCPRLTARMAELQGRLARDRRDGVRLVSFSVDPDNDTPPVLAEFAHQAHADPSRWSFVTGPLNDIEAAAVRGFKVSAAKISRGANDYEVTHGDWFVLVDRAGNLRGYYPTAEEREFEIVVDDAERLDAER